MDNEPEIDALIQLETNYWQALKDQDTQAFLALSHDPCLILGVDGVGAYTKAQIRTMLQQEPNYSVQHFELKELHARLLSPNVGIVAYTVQLTLIMYEERLSFETTDTSTWMRQKGQWACAMHSEPLFGHPLQVGKEHAPIQKEHIRR
jgi:uncharacterized protein (TIGR02246 family)